MESTISIMDYTVLIVGVHPACGTRACSRSFSVSPKFTIRYGAQSNGEFEKLLEVA